MADDLVEIKSLSECESDVDPEIGSDIESEYELDPMVSSAGEGIADIAHDVAHKMHLMTSAMYTAEEESLVDVLAGIRNAINQLNKILYNKMRQE